MENRPTAAELVEAVAHWVRTEALPAMGYHARVAANALDIVHRELAAGPSYFDEDRAALRALLDGPAPDADRELLAAVSARIRSGGLDDRFAEVLAALRPLARRKLALDNPRYLGAGS